MIPKLLRGRRKIFSNGKYLSLFGIFCLVIIWVRQSRNNGGNKSSLDYQQQNQPLPDPPLHDAGLEKFKEIQKQIMEDLNVQKTFKEVKVKQPAEPAQVELPVKEEEKAEKTVPRNQIKGPGNRYDMQIAADLRRQEPGLGAEGKPVRLVGSDLQEAEEIMKKEAVNLLVSDRIQYNRTLPDVRDPMCKDLTYDPSLPTASVIIIFTNEAWSPLIRTIWSVINRSSGKYLKEILLIDDFSDRVDLQGKLEWYIEKELPPIVKLVRLKERQGLIRARLAGAREAKGDVIIFLDSHCEVIIHPISSK